MANSPRVRSESVADAPRGSGGGGGGLEVRRSVSFSLPSDDGDGGGVDGESSPGGFSMSILRRAADEPFRDVDAEVADDAPAADAANADADAEKS